MPLKRKSCTVVYRSAIKDGDPEAKVVQVLRLRPCAYDVVSSVFTTAKMKTALPVKIIMAKS